MPIGKELLRKDLVNAAITGCRSRTAVMVATVLEGGATVPRHLKDPW